MYFGLNNKKMGMRFQNGQYLVEECLRIGDLMDHIEGERKINRFIDSEVVFSTLVKADTWLKASPLSATAYHIQHALL